MDQNSQFAVIIPAAGSSTRFGGEDKLLVEIGGETVLRRTVRLFAGRMEVAEILVITGKNRLVFYETHLKALGNNDIKVLEGGRERWESVLFGLRLVTATIPFVAVHDAARPLTPRPVIDQAFAAAVQMGGAVPLVAESATLKRLGANSLVEKTIPRAGLYQAQTPQCFNRAHLLEAYEKLLARNQLADVTDDAQVFERAGFRVQGTAGSPINIKITTAEDVALGNAMARAQINFRDT